jgi:N-dimethylarginine dimethylaminohydrolase
MGRRHEEIVVKEALTDLGIPILYEPLEGEAFEGCLLLAPGTVFVADTERHNRSSIQKFIDFILGYFDEVLYATIPQERRFMHPDMVINRVTDRLMLYYPPRFSEVYPSPGQISRQSVDLKANLNARGNDLIPLSDKEQTQWGSSFCPAGAGVLINYDISLSPKLSSTAGAGGRPADPLSPGRAAGGRRQPPLPDHARLARRRAATRQVTVGPCTLPSTTDHRGSHESRHHRRASQSRSRW